MEQKEKLTKEELQKLPVETRAKGFLMALANHNYLSKKELPGDKPENLTKKQPTEDGSESA